MFCSAWTKLIRPHLTIKVLDTVCSCVVTVSLQVKRLAPCPTGRWAGLRGYQASTQENAGHLLSTLTVIFKALKDFICFRPNTIGSLSRVEQDISCSSYQHTQRDTVALPGVTDATEPGWSSRLRLSGQLPLQFNVAPVLKYPPF